MSRIVEGTKGFWGKAELWVFGGNLSLHLVITIIGLALMPFAYFSESSLHDGHTYFEISNNLWPSQPFTLLSWHKRILLPLLANIVFPWERHVAFWLLGVIPACLAAVYFYKIARQYTQHPLKLTAVFSLLPWLVFSAHHGLNEPLLIVFLLAGYYYYIQDRPIAYTVCFALALLSKELALLPIAAISLLIWQRHGLKRVLLFAPVVLPFGLFCTIYGWRWHDCLWCLKESPANPMENSFSWKTGFYWIYITLKTGTRSSANPRVAWIYDVFNQGLNLLTMATVWIGTLKLRKIDRDLFVYNLILAIGLIFLGRNQYMLSSSLGRQYLIVTLALLGFDPWLNLSIKTSPVLFKKIVFLTLLILLFMISTLWIVLYSKYFVVNKIF